jgi:hypothetical protein
VTFVAKRARKPARASTATDEENPCHAGDYRRGRDLTLMAAGALCNR